MNSIKTVAIVIGILLLVFTASATVIYVNLPNGSGGNGTPAYVYVNNTFTTNPGTNASVINVGTPSISRLDFFIPTGQNGNNGSVGATGATGATGAIGAQGIQGIQGNTGYPGINGTNGTNGINGTDGINGTNGTNGINGINGSAATVGINSTFTLPAGSAATVGNIGNSSAALFDFAIPQGMKGNAGTIAINSTATGAPGTNASVTNIGNLTDVNLDFIIPQGLTGEMNQTMNQTPGSKGEPGSPGNSGGVVYYFDNAISSDTGYNTLGRFPLNITEQDKTASVSSGSGDVLMDTFITPPNDPYISTVPAGMRTFRVYGYTSDPSGVTEIVMKAYYLHIDNTESPEVLEQASGDINEDNTTLHTSFYVRSTDYTINLTDRLIIRIYARSTSPTPVTAHFVFDGAVHASSLQTTYSEAEQPSLEVPVKEGGASNLYKGQAIYISGVDGTGTPLVLKADRTTLTTTKFVGLAATDTSENGNVIMIRVGDLPNLNTMPSNTHINPNGETWVAGDLLYLDTNGGLTNVRPTSGRITIVGYTMAGSYTADDLLVYVMETPTWGTSASGEDLVMRMGDSAGVNKVSFRNYTNGEVAYILSNGTSSFSSSNYNSSYWTGTNYNESYVNKDGSVAFTGDESMGSHKLTNVITGSGADATNKTYVDLTNSTMKTYVDNANSSMKSYADSGLPYILNSNTTLVFTTNGSYILGTNTSYILADGSRSFTSDESMGSHKLTNVITGSSTDATNKSYVDLTNSSMKSYVDAELPYISSGNISVVFTSNGSYILGTNTSYVLTSDGTYVKTSNTSYVLTDGSRAFTNDESMGSHKLTNVITGAGADATNKTYVDLTNSTLKTYVDNSNSSMKSYVDAGLPYIANSNTSVVLTGNGSYLLGTNTSVATTTYVGNVNSSMKTYVDNSNSSMKSYVDSGLPYISASNTTVVFTSNGSYILGTNTSYVLTGNGSYVQVGNTSYLLVGGSRAMTGNLSLGSNYINSLITGALGSDATNKSYVDSKVNNYNASYVTTTNGSYILGTNTSYVVTSGANGMTGNLSMGSKYINSVLTGNIGSDAVNRSYAGTHGAAASISNGGTITHSLGTTPTGCQVQPTIANTTMSVTAMSSTTLTVSSWRTNSTAAAFSQTVYWECWL